MSNIHYCISLMRCLRRYYRVTVDGNVGVWLFLYAIFKESMHSDNFPDSFYRVSVKGLCVKDDKILLVKESMELSGQWELPGGGLDFGEDLKLGLQREVEEEMRLKIVSVSKQPVYVWTNRIEHRRGMDWYYTVVLGYKIEFADLNFTATSECEAIGFFSRDELQTLDLFQQAVPLRHLFKPEDFRF